MSVLEKVLDKQLYDLLNQKVGFEKISEIRLRGGKPISILSCGKMYYLSKNNGLTYNKDNAMFVSKQEIEDIVYRASEFSIYSVNEEIKQGFIILDGGERIGISGSVVVENGIVKTITNFSSINIRVPHNIFGICLPIFDKLQNNKEIYNTLIISPPGQGKTTFLRDFAFQLSEKNYFYNVLIIDERGEIAGKNNSIQLGNFCDIISFCNKKTGFLQGIRSMNPNIILTDELGAEDDFEAVNFACNSGVKIVATIHAGSLEQLKNKPIFEKYLKNTFDRFVLLKPFGQPGVIEGVFDKNFEKVQ